MTELDDRIDAILGKVGGFTRVGEHLWLESQDCDICFDVHTPRVVELRHPVSEAPVGIYQNGPVRLSDGSNEVWISFGPSCVTGPFGNLTKLLAGKLGMRPLTEHQMFESLDRLYSVLKFSLPGYFYEWDGVELSANEKWSIECGQLLKKFYQRTWTSPVIEFAIDFHEFPVFETEQFGLAFSRFGLLATFWGAEMGELDKVFSSFQNAIDDYAAIVRTVTLRQ